MVEWITKARSGKIWLSSNGLQEAERLITKYIDYYNNERLHSSINYLRPIDYYKGNPEKILKEREDKILRAKESRKIKNKEYNLKLKLSLGATD